jgi:hypothetical protein
MFSENREINLLTEKTITPEMKGALSRLDEMSLGNSKKIEIVGCFCGVKPVAWESGLFDEENLPPDVEKLTGIIKDMGLQMKFKTSPPDIDCPNFSSYEFIVSKDAEKISQLEEFSKNPSAEPEKIGKLLGYPESSTRAFKGESERLSQDDLIRLYRSQNAAHFSIFILSKENYQEEINSYGKKIELATKEFLPKTYQKFIKEQNCPEN